MMLSECTFKEQSDAAVNVCVFCVSVLQGLPDPETVSSSIQQMWALTEIMQASQTAASIGRFDVSRSSVNSYHYPYFVMN